jgi:hypothetical protein
MHDAMSALSVPGGVASEVPYGRAGCKAETRPAEPLFLRAARRVITGSKRCVGANFEQHR